MKKIRLGLHGFGEHPWRSVDRTRGFYLDALTPEFELSFAEGSFAESGVDAVLSFVGGSAWDDLCSAKVPYLFAIHGGATLDHVALRSHAGRLRSADTLIVNCASDETILRKMFIGRGPRFCRLPLPAGGAYFGEIEPAYAREQLPFEGEPDLVLGFVARLLPQKNFHRFLGMLAELSELLAPRRIDAVVIGEYWTDYPVLPYMTRDYREYVAALARELGVKDRVVYLGSGLDDEQLRLAYGAMDVLLHPTCSLDENFGYVPIEAMASGVPVVGAAYGGLKDTILHGETGYLMPTWTTSSGLRMDLIGGVEHTARLLRDPALRARLAGRARSHAQAQYSRPLCAERLVSAVREAVEAYALAAPLQAAPPLAFPRPAGYLPPLKVGWEHYWPVVDDYVQGALPSIGETTRLRLAAPAYFEASRLKLLDPAWPATIPLEPEERRICLACQTTRYRSELGAEDALLDALVAKGALIASNLAEGGRLAWPRASA
ncbi:MAG TPA: glycosyltransferase family 4 protein [Polyangiaceae bacterium]|nr:glycosyltransferase family 4 protein [Polyangiaceae bacterium]